MPTSPIFRRSASVRADVEKLRTDETNENMPNAPTTQAPIDIGSQNLSTRSMLRNRVGTPRSAMRRTPQAMTSGSDST